MFANVLIICLDKQRDLDVVAAYCFVLYESSPGVNAGEVFSRACTVQSKHGVSTPGEI